MAEASSGPRVLSGWKEIANYMGRGVRTVQRYERELELPVRRPAGKQSLVAISAEIDAWIKDNCVTFAGGAEPARIPLASTELSRRVQSTHNRTLVLRQSLAAMMEKQRRLQQLTSELVAHLRNANSIVRTRLVAMPTLADRDDSLPLAS